ncbi:uncharacterized protein ACLA_020000 [Aspergillus clavatus NRRL 1]|uniref:Four-carbon acid sugar kinase N-terminal domain-containing protein n=1 Tax=Aspergillus clavatus (strain ATCC 1007 / CBS 513.65 / DSM 816 / NCTC 3887 / NRRL 1 / QM 1276 / 107) TaxID=344612 RepID=A1CNS4_ASPCL|nr:uncharacterized protein ACLA_020000 [Aspergillus clavatus NRRL 1]EAW07295.1 conserved hypothetical protein [Aspergillus clavatus NRRL 1]
MSKMTPSSRATARSPNPPPPEFPADTQDQISQLLSTSSLSRLVVLDDDSTRTQTCHDVAVLTVWDIPTLTEEFEQESLGFFNLTNSRALPPLEAEKLIRAICGNVAEAAKLSGQTVDIVLRGDSTLRGHFPLEADVAQSVFGATDAWVLAPFFFQGGRFTINDVHYVAEGESLVPAGLTQFAKDATFGYKSSNLRDYVMEKAPGRFTPEQGDIRNGGPERVYEKLMSFPKGGVVIVNAAAESDMHVFVAGLLLAEAKGKHFLYRTGAAFVSTRLGIRSIPPITAPALDLPRPRQIGALILAGAVVPKTTAQLKFLTDARGPTGALAILEIDVADLIASPTSAAAVVDKTGGITSSEAASKGLGIKRAVVIGQAAPGVLLWRCDEPTSRHQGVSFVVFPGNVGGEETLCELVETWS